SCSRVAGREGRALALRATGARGGRRRAPRGRGRAGGGAQGTTARLGPRPLDRGRAGRGPALRRRRLRAAGGAGGPGERRRRTHLFDRLPGAVIRPNRGTGG